MMFKDISGVILAGGKNSRMGLPKAFLNIDGKRIIDIQLELFKSLFEEILIVTNNPESFLEFGSVRIVEDMIKECGPIGGIYTGLRMISNKEAFFVACDMPFLHNDLIKKIIRISENMECDCVVPRITGYPEPLHALYSKDILKVMKKSMVRKALPVREFLKSCKCEYLDIDKTERNESRSFCNINTQRDYRGITTEK